MDEALPYRVVLRPGNSGRVAVATRYLQPGEVVLVERAIACVAASGRSLCDDCLDPIREGTTHCVGCRTLHGCKAHQDTSATPSVRLSAKILGRRCSGLLGDEQTSRVDSLLHHEQLFARDCRRDQEKDCAKVAILAAARMNLEGAAGSSNRLLEDSLRVLSDCCDGFTVPKVLQLVKEELGRVSVNAITACDGSGATGLGLFPSTAMFNHSCSPNTQAWWKGCKLELRCTKEVAVGEELCFSYISVDQPSVLRREQLRHSWFFTCLCQRCISKQWDTELTGLQCPVTRCAGVVPPPPWTDTKASCNRCGCALGELLVDGAREVSCEDSTATTPRATPLSTLVDCCGGKLDTEEFGEEKRLLGAQQDFEDGVEAYMREDPETALVALEKSLAVRESILHSFNKDVLRTLRYASYAAIATHSWSKAHSFLLRWLHPMDVMFSAAEIWDIAAMRIDMGLVLDKLHSTQIEGTEQRPPLLVGAFSESKPSTQSATDRMHPAAAAELAQGLRWIWICLGKNSGLPAESAALEACSERYSF